MATHKKTDQQFISVIIPAYNEAATIAAVINAVSSCQHVGEIIIVDDGSTDNTASIAKNNGARVITHTVNSGKAAAMTTGVDHAKYYHVCFLDADTLGFTHDHLHTIIEQVIDGTYDMFIGVRARNTYLVNKWLRIGPLIGGERALTKELWYSVPAKYKKKFQIEIALNYHAKRHGKRMGFTLLHGLDQVEKEQKWGFWYGLFRRMLMNWDVILIAIRLYIFATIRDIIRMKHLPKPMTKPTYIDLERQ